MTKPKLAAALLMSAAIIALLSCTTAPSVSPTATPDYDALETKVALELRASLTAKAPLPTQTPTPRAEEGVLPPAPSPTPTFRPSPIGPVPLLAYVRVMQDQATNIVIQDRSSDVENVLTHFAEPLNMTDLTWSNDGQWLVFVSGHAYLRSRHDERNVFVIRPDSSGMRMITGDYADPESIPGPYVTLRGQVEGSEGPCAVYVQGAASPVTAETNGRFEVPGVSVSARWARAVCKPGEIPLQGDVDLALVEGDNEPITITVQAEGQGWSQVSVSQNGCRLAGVHYRWTLDENQKQQYQVEGLLASIDGTIQAKLELAPESILNGVDWSPVENHIVGAVSQERGTWLWLWDANGASLGAMHEMLNPQDVILTTKNPVWSPDGSQVAFELSHRYWWGDTRAKTELMVYSKENNELRTLVAADWSQHALHPSWSADGNDVYYQFTKEEQVEDKMVTIAHLWSIAAGGGEPNLVLEDSAVQLPAMRPMVGGASGQGGSDAAGSPCLEGIGG